MLKGQIFQPAIICGQEGIVRAYETGRIITIGLNPY